MHNRAALKEY